MIKSGRIRFFTTKKFNTLPVSNQLGTPIIEERLQGNFLLFGLLLGHFDDRIEGKLNIFSLKLTAVAYKKPYAST
jgi:hypothetical protein